MQLRSIEGNLLEDVFGNVCLEFSHIANRPITIEKNTEPDTPRPCLTKPVNPTPERPCSQLLLQGILIARLLQNAILRFIS